MKHLPLSLCASLVALRLAEGSAAAQTERSEPQASGTEIPAETRALFRKGLAAYNSGQVETARQLFLQAWAIRPSADVAMELAQTEMDLGRYVEAAAHLDYALRNFTPSINERMRNIAKQAYSEARHHVARLSVEVDQRGAEVLLNGRVVGRSPLPGPLYADTGNCVVQARLGHQTASQSFSAESGKDFGVRLVLGPPAITTTSAPQRNVDTSEPRPFSDGSSSRTSLIPVAIGATLATLGIAAGVALRLASNADEDKAKKLAAGLGAENCVGANANSPACSALRDSLQTSDRERNWSTACFLVGSAALVGTAAFWFWPRKNASAAPELQVTGTAGPSSAGLLLSGAF